MCIRDVYIGRQENVSPDIMKFTHHASDYPSSRRLGGGGGSGDGGSRCAPVFPKDSKNERWYAAILYKGFASEEAKDRRRRRRREAQRPSLVRKITLQIASRVKLAQSFFRYFSPLLCATEKAQSGSVRCFFSGSLTRVPSGFPYRDRTRESPQN